MGLIINVDKVEKIHVNKAIIYKYATFIKGKPEKYKFFGLIKTQKATEDHWLSVYDEEYSSREELVKDKPELYINYDAPYEESIWRKCNLNIIMNNSDNVLLQYDTMVEMDNAIINIIQKSKNNLVIIKD